MVQLMLIVLAASLLIGVLGRNRKFGFWGYFFASILLSPLVGLLLVVASSPKPAPSVPVVVSANDE